MRSLAHGAPADACWTEPRERLLITAADALHEDATLPDELCEQLASVLDEEQLLELTMLCGGCHAICFVANTTRVPLEEYGPRFAEVA